MAQRNSTKRKPTTLTRLMAVTGFAIMAALILSVSAVLWAQTATDPGPRTGAAGAGNIQNGITSDEKTATTSAAQPQFSQSFAVPMTSSACTLSSPCTILGSGGLGPRFNSNSCSSCHAQPEPGGSSPPSNPLFSVYQASGAKNSMPSFEVSNGPVLVPRFPNQLTNLSQSDGLVHQLFTIAGRTDASSSCTLAQPNFTQASQDNDLVFRQPLPLYGDGYIEIVQNKDILNNLNSNLNQKQAMGIGGAANIADDGTVSRMGWKAQWRAILPAAGAELNAEMGVTNEMFPTETDQTQSACITNPIPEDATNYTWWNTSNYPWNFIGSAERDSIFIRFLAAPTPGSCPGGNNSSCSNGATQFANIGCALCHTTSYTTPAGSIPSMGHVKIYLYSDLLLHHMGNCLADNVSQGVAAGDMWRTPPLWNVGQRYWFMHDGRTNNIVTAIEDHSSLISQTTCTGNGTYGASEANSVIGNFNNLSAGNQQDLINFLRSL